MKKIERFLLNTVILVVTSIFIRSMSMAFRVIIAHKIGSDGVGLFELIMSVYFLAMTIANSGIGLASTRIVAEELAENEEVGAKIAIKKCIIYSLFFGIFSCILLSLSSPLICTYFFHNRIQPIALYIIAISLPFTAIASSITGYFIGIKKISKNSIYEIINTILKIIISLALINYTSPSTIELSCIMLIIANTISEIISFIYLYINYKLSLTTLQYTSRKAKNYLKRVLTISVPVAITSYLRSLLSTIKQILIPLRLEKHGMSCELALSNYGQINGMVMPLLLFPGLIINSISELLIPEFARYNTKKDYKRMQEVINTIFKLCIIFSFLILGLYICFNSAISIFTYNDLEIVKYLLALTPLSFFIYLDHIIDAILKGIDKQLGVMYCNIIDLFISILLIYILIPIYGIWGYIFILYLSEIFNFAISLLQLYKDTHFSFDITKRYNNTFSMFCNYNYYI